MTYCVGMLLQAGLVMLADSRTNAGVDHINTFRKLRVYERPGERCLVLMSAGNLAITQSLASTLDEVLRFDGDSPGLLEVPTMFEAARHIGDVLRAVHRRDAESLAAFGIDFNASLILGGQIAGEPPRLFSIYAAGNFIEATRETPYFQIGESKYGKPILDRVLRWDTPLDEAVKCALVSMVSTIRSNLSLGLPLDLAIIERDGLSLASHHLIDAENAYFAMVRARWGDALREAFAAIPNPDGAFD